MLFVGVAETSEQAVRGPDEGPDIIGALWGPVGLYYRALYRALFSLCGLPVFPLWTDTYYGEYEMVTMVSEELFFSL